MIPCLTDTFASLSARLASECHKKELQILGNSEDGIAGIPRFLDSLSGDALWLRSE
jgi:hypothetical protein